MRKRLINLPAGERDSASGDWLRLDELAEVELTSEESTHPVEAALAPGKGPGWRASSPGPQTIRLRFSRPLNVRRMRIAFEEPERSRTQEFVLRWSSARSEGWREIVRQQFNFSPAGASREVEEYRVELTDVVGLELIIVPEIGGGEARASLQEFRVG